MHPWVTHVRQLQDDKADHDEMKSIPYPGDESALVGGAREPIDSAHDSGNGDHYGGIVADDESLGAVRHVECAEQVDRRADHDRPNLRDQSHGNNVSRSRS